MEVVSQGALADEGWHATFSPSASERWLNCPASVVELADEPRRASKDAALGTAAHTLAARAFTYDRDAEFFKGEQIENDGMVFTVDDDMISAVQFYLDDVRRRVMPGDHFMFEQRVYFSETIGIPEQGGTSDCIILHEGCTRLTVEDYKHGMGVPVSAVENTQMMIYALAVLETFDAIMDDVQEINLVICQPRIDNLSEWTCTRADLEALRDRMREAAAKAHTASIDKEITGKIRPELYGVSEKGCRWCGIKATCDAYREFVARSVYDDFQALDEPAAAEVIGQPDVPQAADKLGGLFGVLGVIEDWCRGIRSEVERRLVNGMEVIGPDGQPMKLVEGKKGSRKWQDEAQAAAILVGRFGPKVPYTEPKLLSVAKAEALYKGKAGKAEFEDMLGSLIVQPPGKASVALGSDPRPPYQPAAAEDEFEALADE